MKLQISWFGRVETWSQAHRVISFVILGVLIAAILTTIALFFILPRFITPEYDGPPIVEEPEPGPPRYFSSLTGQEIGNPALDSSPITCIMIENSTESRPQSGLNDAALVYEAIAEGGVTRFLTIWQNSDTKLIGPVRSARMHYVEWATPYDCSVAHVGGAEDALQLLRTQSNGYRDIDQFFNDRAYWRATDRYAPHNVYTSSVLLAELNTAKGFTDSQFTPISRSERELYSDTAATQVDIKIGSSATYNPSFAYDAEADSYLRSYGGTPHMTTTTCADLEKPQIKDCAKAQIAPRIVIAIMTTSAVRPGNNYQNVVTTGSGDATIFFGGTAIAAQWQKASRPAQIKFYDKSGAELSFPVGQIWLIAVPTGSGAISYQ